MKRRAVIAAGTVAALVALYYGGDYLLRGQYVERTDDAYVSADTATLAARIGGYVASIDVAENQAVKAGDVLLTIERGDYEARVAQAAAAADAKRAAVANTEARIQWENSIIATADAAVTSAEAEERRTSEDLVRYAELKGTQSVSAQRYEAALAASKVAKASLEKARAAADAERAQLAVLASSLTQAQAEMAQAEAALKLAQIDLDNTIIRAPFDGVVGNRVAQKGQYVRTGAMLLSVVPLPNVFIVANFKETQVGEIRRGQTVAVSIDALPGTAFTGRVESFSPATGSIFSLLPPENATGNFTKVVQRVPVRIALDITSEAVRLLRPGMSAVVDIDTREEGEGPDAVLAAHPRPEATASSPTGAQTQTP